MPTLKRLLPAPQGKCVSNRYQMRRFKFSQDMHTFLCKADNSLHWSECEDLPSGYYSSRVSYDPNLKKSTVTFHKV